MPELTLLAVPNFSEGSDATAIAAIAAAFGGAVRLLDVHSDSDHNRTVYTLAGEQGSLAAAVASAARKAIEVIDIRRHAGVHPRVGAVDVAPIVYTQECDKGSASAEALTLADMLGQLGVPVFLYGALARGRTRAQIRRGGPSELARRIAAGELVADFGPKAALHPGAGATLVAARPPLVAFNLELEPPAGIDTARAIAATIRESGDHGLAGVRAIGLWLEHEGVAQVSTNVEDPSRTPLAAVVAAVAQRAPVRRAELVGLAPRSALQGFPEAVPLRAEPRLIEDALNA
jgi:glutamate formiminotransferase